MTRFVEAATVRGVPELIRRPAESRPVPRRILVAIGLLWDDAPAVSMAAALAVATAAELVLVGVAPVALPEADPTMGLDGLWARSHWDDQALLDQLMRDHLSEVAAGLSAGVRVRTVVDWGGRATGLLHACQVEHPDLVVVSHVQGGLLRRLLHNHADRAVLRNAEAPVLVVPVTR
jgi:nucleotide-binding universal stress UspA family protein